MTNEQKTAVQKAALAAARSVEQRDTPIATAIERSSVAKWFKAGAQTILDNPQEWFPPVQYWQLRDENERLQSQLSRYRAALEDAINIVHSLSEPIQELIDVLEGAYYEGK